MLKVRSLAGLIGAVERALLRAMSRLFATLVLAGQRPRVATSGDVARTSARSTRLLKLVLGAVVLAAVACGATIGRVVQLPGGASDLAFDEARGLVYLSQSVEGQVQVYSIAKQTFTATIPTDQTPLAMALSRDGKYLFVTCYDAAALDVIDLSSLTMLGRVALPAKPEGVAVGADGHVLISTSGAGTNGAASNLLLYDPTPGAAVQVAALSVTPPTPAAPTFPPDSARPFLARHSQLVASRSGAFIAGVNMASNTATAATVFVYEAASHTVLRSRTVAGASTTLAISDDSSRIMSGAVLFDAGTLQVLATQNLANSPYPMDPSTSFIAKANQGGAAFAPDGQTLYAAYNVPPVGGLPGAPPMGQMTLSDPDNLLIKLGLQLPENLAGRLVVSSDGASAFALSDSGFTAISLAAVAQSVLAVPASDVVLLTNDQCQVAGGGTATIAINNPGRGNVAATAALLQFAGPATATANGSPALAPSVRPGQGANGASLTFTYNPAAARGPGTVIPPHDFLVSAPQAVNLPDRIRVLQNNHDSDAPGTIVPIATGTGSVILARLTAGLNDLVWDAARKRVYIANTGLNRVEVFDAVQQKLLAPIKAGQFPFSLALTPDGNTLYAANAGSETISIIDPDKLQVSGNVTYPPLAFNSAQTITTPFAIAAAQTGLQVLMTNGQLWSVNGTLAAPRGVSKVIGQTTAGLPNPIPVPSSMAATPGGEYVLLATSTGVAYLYQASVDDFVATRQLYTAAAATGYIGPVTAGPNGQYFIVNGIPLSLSLVTGRSIPGLVAGVAAIGATSFAAFLPPALASATAIPASFPVIQVFDATTGAPVASANVLEGPAAQVVGAAKATVPGRTVVVDASTSTAYVLTVSGLSVVPLNPAAVTNRPLPNAKGAVNLASYQSSIAANGLLSIFGQNLGDNEMFSSTPLPIVLGGTCVTLNNVPLPLFWVSPAQINAQIPPNTAPGTYPLVVRSIANRTTSASQSVTISALAPAVLVDSTGQIALVHADGQYVTQDNPAMRDEPLMMFAVGLGATTGAAVAAGVPSPSGPLAVTSSKVQVYFGDPRLKQSAVIVDWAGLAPGFIGIYQLNLRVPGFHASGSALPVTVKVGTASSPSSGPVVPNVAVN